MRVVRIGAIVSLIALCVAAESADAFETAGVISGIADARDGDDIIFGKVSVRLQGIAAPEDRRGNVQPGGPEATQNLSELVLGRFVVCHLDGTEADNRPVGVCYLGLTELNEYQVLTGRARDCPAFSGGRYAEAEQKARVAGNDLSAIYSLPDYCVPK